MKKSTRSTFVIIAVFGLLFLMRFIHLDADPPADLSQNSIGYISDPGSYVVNARNKVALGQWETDLWNMMHVSPLPHYVTYLVFLLFGPGVGQMNLVPVIFCCLLLILMYCLFKKYVDKKLAMIAVVVLGINYQFTMFSRIAVRVMPQFFFAFLALYLLDRKEDKKIPAFLAGISCFIAFTVKGTFAQIFPAILIGYAFFLFFKKRKSIKSALMLVGLFLSGVILTSFIWYLTFYLPHTSMIQAYAGENIDWLTFHSIREIINNFWGRQLFFFNEMPVMTILASLFLLGIAYEFFKSPDKIMLIDWVCSFWMISNMLYFSVITYHASRHFVLVVPPILILGLRWIYEFIHTTHIKKPDKFPLFFFLFLFGWLIFPLSAVFILQGRPVEGNRQAAFYSVLLIALAVTALVFLILKLWPKKFRIQIPARARIGLVSLLILLSAAVNLSPYFKWAFNPRFDIKHISQDLGSAFDRMHLSGLIAPLMGLHNSHEVHPYRSNYINPFPDYIQRFKITHIIPTVHAGGIEMDQYEINFPKEMRRKKLLARFPLWKTYAELYALNPDTDTITSGPAAENHKIYEGETFYGQNGIPRYDPDASGKYAFLADKFGRGFMLEYSAGEEIPEGRKKASYWIKVPSLPEEDLPVLRFYIIDTERQRVISSKNINSLDLKESSEYQRIDLPFALNKPREVSFRVYSFGTARFWFDKAEIISQ
ncbi:MAG: glycosyltransferase family 39 protein [Candidatus Aminicenantes bacterium]|nr:glycosyltransferase family 39 protein [Candidatus Aminicenantes bacterium]